MQRKLTTSTRNGWKRAVMGLALCLGLAWPAAAQEFLPDLGLAPEMIDAGRLQPVQIPAGAAELMAHPMTPEQPRPLLTEVPGRPFLEPQDPPTRRHWWKYPFYVAIGLPRDLLDGAMGVLSHVPVLSIPEYVVYEIVPTQALLRDPRDWHRWDGNPNRHSHGFYDGNRWGYFPSWNMWTFESPVADADSRVEQVNAELREELRLLNREIEEANRAIAARRLEARTAALTAIQQGDGGEAVRRMVPYFQAYPLDTEGAFALLATGLALYAPEGPAWIEPMLWHRLNNAQPSALLQTAELLDSTLEMHPDAPVAWEALIYIQLMLNDEARALRTARRYLELAPEDQRRLRLLLETALTAGDAETAREANHKIDLAQIPVWERQVLQARLALLDPPYETPRLMLAQLQDTTPENAYLNYYLGAAVLLEAQAGHPDLENYQRAFDYLELAALQASHPALRRRAGAALAFARSLLAEAARRPEIFGPTVPLPELR